MDSTWPYIQEVLQSYLVNDVLGIIHKYNKRPILCSINHPDREQTIYDVDYNRWEKIPNVLDDDDAMNLSPLFKYNPTNEQLYQFDLLNTKKWKLIMVGFDAREEEIFIDITTTTQTLFMVSNPRQVADLQITYLKDYNVSNITSWRPKDFCANTIVCFHSYTQSFYVFEDTDDDNDKILVTRYYLHNNKWETLSSIVIGDMSVHSVIGYSLNYIYIRTNNIPRCDLVNVIVLRLSDMTHTCHTITMDSRCNVTMLPNDIDMFLHSSSTVPAGEMIYYNLNTREKNIISHYQKHNKYDENSCRVVFV